MVTTHLNAFLRALARAGAPDDALGGDCVIDPPETDFGYESTPPNALAFATMGVDGVHYALVARDGEFDDSSPVIQVSPMDFDEPLTVLASSFVEYLADGCGVDVGDVSRLLDADTPESDAELAKLVSTRFRRERLLEEQRVRRLNERWLSLVVLPG